MIALYSIIFCFIIFNISVFVDAIMVSFVTEELFQ